MTLYSKNGSIPKPETDGTDGWIEVPDRPDAPQGKEVVWWFPPGWVVRDPRPAPVEGYEWSWSQTEECWVSCPSFSHNGFDADRVLAAEPSSGVTLAI